MAEFRKPEFTADAAVLDHRDACTFEHTFNNQRFLLALLQRPGVHEGCIDIARPVSGKYDQQEQCFHDRDNFE